MSSPLAMTASSHDQSLSLPPSAQVIEGINIHHYIDYKVQLSGKNYRKWRHTIHYLLTRYNARHHIEEETDVHLADAIWLKVDVTICLWFLATLSDDLHAVVLHDDGTAYSTWEAIIAFFTANKPARAMHLRREFHDFKQGDMSIAVYCSALQSLADDLSDVDDPISDIQLTMQLVEGLGEGFEIQAEYLRTALPSFAVA